MKIRSERIRILYGNKGWTQKDLAFHSGLSKQGLNSMLLKGSCSPDSLISIAKALNVEPEALIRE